MEQSIKKDLKISVVVGLIAGILILPTLRNVGIDLNLQRSIIVVAALLAFTPSGYLTALFLSRWFPVMLQIVKFGIAGGLSAMIDFGILNSLIYSTGLYSGIYFSLFKAISYIIAVTNSYFWNKYWTFKVFGAASGREFLKFFLANFVGFAINIGGASFVVNVIRAPAGVSGELWANIGAVSSIAISLVWNFWSMKFLVFKKSATISAKDEIHR